MTALPGGLSQPICLRADEWTSGKCTVRGLLNARVSDLRCSERGCRLGAQHGQYSDRRRQSRCGLLQVPEDLFGAMSPEMLGADHSRSSSADLDAILFSS